MGLRTIAVYSDADRDAPHVRAADAAAHIGGSAPKDSYLNIEAIVAAARRSGAEAVHPGYGFLSESAEFASAVLKATGCIWIGPPPAAIAPWATRPTPRRSPPRPACRCCRPTRRIPSFPVMIKALAGGGGRGMRLVRSQGELEHALKTAQVRGRARLRRRPGAAREGAARRRATSKCRSSPTAHGNCIHLGERDCSVQRRHQKLVEESPSPAVDAKLRAAMGAAAIAAARAVDYVGAGTVEFLLEDGRFWFMEMNTRLQVEHPVTEAITGLDLVEWQLRVAAGEPLPARQEDIRFSGHAIEVRLCAEDPERDFLPQAGTLALWGPSAAVRVDHALESGMAIPPFYDSMIAKLIAHAPTRDEARAKLAAALDETVALGIPTNKDFLAAVLRDGRFRRRQGDDGFLWIRSSMRNLTCGCGRLLRRLRRVDRLEQQPGARRARFGERRLLHVKSPKSLTSSKATPSTSAAFHCAIRSTIRRRKGAARATAGWWRP